MFAKEVGEPRVEPIPVADFKGEAQRLRQSFHKRREPREKVRLCRERIFVEIGKLDEDRPKLFMEQSRAGYEFVEFGLAIEETPLVRDELGHLKRENKERRSLNVPAVHRARCRRPVKRAVHLDGLNVLRVVAEMLCGLHLGPGEPPYRPVTNWKSELSGEEEAIARLDPALVIGGRVILLYPAALQSVFVGRRLVSTKVISRRFLTSRNNYPGCSGLQHVQPCGEVWHWDYTTMNVG